MNPCEKIRALLGRYVDGELEPGEVNRVDSHLSVCERCAEELRLMEREAELLRDALVPETSAPSLDPGLWYRLRRARGRWVTVAWYAAAVAASIFVALIIGTAVQPGRAHVELARVTGCSGPLELGRAGRAWQALATYSMLRDGDRVRCAMGQPGSLVLNGRRRLDLHAETELMFRADGGFDRFDVRLERGRIHAALPGPQHPFTIQTEIADVVVTEQVGASGGARFEVVLSDVPPRLGLLDRIHLLPAAYAAPAEPELEVVVYEGSVLVIREGQGATSVEAGQRVRVAARGPVPEPEGFELGLRRQWWPRALPVLARADEALPLPPSPKEVVREPGPRDATDGPEDFFKPLPDDDDPPGPVTPDPDPTPLPLPPTVELDGPPAPIKLTAVPDIGSVVLTWKPAPTGKRPVVEYGVYRRAPGDSDFALVGRAAAQGKQTGAGFFRDEGLDGLSLGIKYEYRVAAAMRSADGELEEGAMSAVVTGAPADFRIYYAGGAKELAAIVVLKRHKGIIHRKTFMVRKYDPDEHQSGQIGAISELKIKSPRGVWRREQIDFSTGYRLVGIINRIDPGDRHPKPKPAIIIENRLGLRREIAQDDAAAGVRP